MQVIAEIPDQLVPVIVEMFQTTYPTLVIGLSPSKQVQAVMSYWVRTMMINYAATKAQQEGDVLVKQVTDARDQAIVSARQQMDDATKFLVEQTPVDPAPTDPATDTPVVGG